MGRYLKILAQRILQFFASLLILLVLCFGLLRFFPGSPFVHDEYMDPQVLAHLQNFYGLNQSLFEQMQTYLSRILTGDLGVSMHFVGRSVTSLIWEYGQTSALLGLLAFSIAVGFSFFYSLGSRLTRFQEKTDFLLLLGVSIPTFALGPLLIWFFGFYLEILPVALLETPSSYLLPIFILALKPALSLARVLSSSMDLISEQKYIQTARSVGFSESKVLSKWVLKNSLGSFLSQVGPLFASLISGSFLVEILFSIPGLGFQFVESVLNRDWPMILGLTLFYGAILMLSQLITDLIAHWIDPRVKSA